MLEPVVGEEQKPSVAEPPAAQPQVTEPAEDAKTAAAVDDIVEKEGDDLLAAEDKELNQAFTNKPPSFGQKIKNFFKGWWANPKARWLTIITLVVIVLAVALVPTTRYAVLNTAGVRSSSSVIVLDESTQQPLKNVTVSLGSQTAVTNEDGKASLTQLRLGRSTLTVQKKAFATDTRTVTIGWGSNPLGNMTIKPVGTQYSFLVTNYLTGKPITKAEATSGEADATSDEKGVIKLTVDKNAPASFEVSISKDGLRTEKIMVSNESTASRDVKMVSQHAHTFVSKRSGKYDVYKIDIDGKNEKLLLAGTGRERDDLALVPHPATDMAALVSTRENKHNSDGYLTSSLVLIDVTDNSTTTLAESERIQVIDWSGDELVYAQISAGASAANPKRQRLISYNVKTKASKDLAAANYFNDVAFADGKLYYAPSSNNLGGGLAGLYQVNADGTNRQTVLPQEVWNIFRTSYDHFTLSVPQQWYDYKLGNTIATKLSGEPANPDNRLYVDSADGQHSLWVDSRDGKGVLVSYDTGSSKETTLTSQSGLVDPVYWVDGDTVIYRVKTSQETADYVLSINGGDPHKLKDVSNASGIGTWFYY